MKKVFPIILISLLFISCRIIIKNRNQLPPNVDLSKCDYAIMVANHTDKPVTIQAYFYDDITKKLRVKCLIGTAAPNQSGVLRYNAFQIMKDVNGDHKTYVTFKALSDNTPINLDENLTTEKIWLVDLKFNYTVCHFSNNQNYIRHYDTGIPSSQQSTTINYDPSDNSYVEFKLYDELSWLKGKWVMTSGYGFDTLVFEEGSPYSIINEYQNGSLEYTELVINWISLNNYSDTFYVNADKTIIKQVHPNILDPETHVVSIYEKVE